MTLKQLEVFVAIAESGSFSKGAEQTGITQSTASQHIKGLEKLLGVRLFDRGGREGALLTEAGKLFFGRASKIMADCVGSRAAIQRFINMDGVVLKIGASDIAGSHFIPEALGRFREANKGVCLDLHQNNSSSVLRKLAEEDVELGFIGCRFDDERFGSRQIGEDTLLLAKSPRLDSAGNGSLSQSELCRVPIIGRENGSGTQKAVNEALAATWINSGSLRVVARFSSSDAVRRALLSGAGYGFISDLAIKEELANGSLVAVRIPGIQIKRRFYSVWREGRELSPAARALLDSIPDLKR